VNCLEFRRAVGAEPFAAGDEVRLHRQHCVACARYQDELQALDRLLGKAMQVQWPSPQGAAGRRPGERPTPSSSRRWLAMAASLLAGVLVAASLWVSYPRPTLAAEVMDHARHEPASWETTRALTDHAVSGVLGEGVHLRSGAGAVTYARRCFFDGHWVPHLVVQSEAGPVTVFLLAHRQVRQPTHIDDQGLSAVVLPAPRGSIAVVGRNPDGLDAIARQVVDHIDWDA
jgi:hypothetical protein